MPQFHVYYEGPRKGETTFWLDKDDPEAVANLVAKRHFSLSGHYVLSIFKVSLEDYSYHLEIDGTPETYDWKNAVATMTDAYQYNATVSYFYVLNSHGLIMTQRDPEKDSKSDILSMHPLPLPDARQQTSDA